MSTQRTAGRLLIGFLVLGAGWVWAGQPPAPAGPTRVDPAPQSLFPSPSTDQVLAAFQGGALFLDARVNADYTYGHIPGALNLPFRAMDFEERLTAFLNSPKGRLKLPVLAYCSGCCSTDALFLAKRLQDLGFTGIQIYRDGYPGWARAGYPRAAGNLPGDWR